MWKLLRNQGSCPDLSQLLSLLEQLMRRQKSNHVGQGKVSQCHVDTQTSILSKTSGSNGMKQAQEYLFLNLDTNEDVRERIKHPQVATE